MVENIAILRMVQLILGVLAGFGCIYFVYRWFSQVVDKRNQGNFRIPGLGQVNLKADRSDTQGSLPVGAEQIRQHWRRWAAKEFGGPDGKIDAAVDAAMSAMAQRKDMESTLKAARDAAVAWREAPQGSRPSAPPTTGQALADGAGARAVPVPRVVLLVVTVVVGNSLLVHPIPLPIALLPILTVAAIGEWLLLFVQAISRRRHRR
jgi:hypothetical protein